MARRSYCRLILPVLAALAAPVTVHAQAWLPDQGSFNASFIFNDVLNKEHWTPAGYTVDVGHTRSQTYALLANYGLTDRVMVAGSLPFVVTKFMGESSHGGVPGFDVDDGDEHGSFTDLRLGIHYQLLERPFALAPFVAYVTPVATYYTRGHAAQGRHLQELILGFGAGKSLDPWVSRTYLQMRYSYAFVEEEQDVSHDRSNLNFEIGKFFTPRWNVSLYGAWQWTHGGIEPTQFADYWFHHDQLLNDDFFNAGIGTGFALTPEITAFAMYMHGLDGKNGHKMNHGVTFGFTWGYRPRAEAVLADERAADEP